MAGMMVMPPLLMRFGTALAPVQARRAGLWATLMLTLWAGLLATARLSPAAVERLPSRVGSSLVEAGLMAAIFAAAAGFAFAVANVLSNDLHRPLLAPNASASRKLVVARLLVIAVVGAAAAATLTVPVDAGRFVSLSLSLACAGLAPVVLATRFIPGLGPAAAVVAMLAGSATALALGLGYRHPAVPALDEAAAGVAGAAMGLAALVAVGLPERISRHLRRKKAQPPLAAPVEDSVPPPKATGKRLSRRRAAAET
jgi:Na+/proline symporter